MGEARIGGALLAMALALSGLGPAAAAAQSRFLSYGSENECVAGRVLAAAMCRSAFANARTEFAARTRSFASMAQCAETYGSCAPWPPGTSATASFRPRWDGVDIVDTPQEKSVTPTAAGGTQRLSFAPQPLTEFRSLDVRGARGSPDAGPPSASQARSQRVPRGEEPAAASAATPPLAGSGFRLEDGVLTYPAPQRFQPKNLPKP